MHSFYSDRDDRLYTYNLYCDLWEADPAAAEHQLYWNEADYNPEQLTAVTEDSFLAALPNYMPMHITA